MVPRPSTQHPAVGSGLAPSNNEKRKQKTKVILLEPESQTAGPMLAGPPPKLIRDRGCWALCQACWARHICGVQRVPGWKERSKLRAGACGCRDPCPNPPPSLHPPQQHPLEGLLLWQLTWGTLPGLSPHCEQSPRRERTAQVKTQSLRLQRGRMCCFTFFKEETRELSEVKDTKTEVKS